MILQEAGKNAVWEPMKLAPVLILAATIPCVSAKDEVQGETDTPQLPGVPYHVHDSKRPQPPTVATMGAVSVKPPSDATVLFDGSSLDAWSTNGGKPAFLLKNGVMIAHGKDIQTRKSFGAIQLHLEWRLPAGRPVDGQKGGNSGVFLMGLYEVQILQSHQNPTYADGSAGALYGQLPPSVNATAPQGEWQSYDIAFEPPVYDGKTVTRPAKITVIHNGVILQHGERFLGPTQWRKLASYPEQHPATGPITLQFHGDPMEFRNIWVRPLQTRE
jgi:hypothetical protein